MSTVSLQMIVNDEYEAVAELIGQALNYFDEINITVSHKPTANKLKKVAQTFFTGKFDNLPTINIKYREWNDRFDEARNANLKLSTTDYFFWLDADDSFDFSTIPRLVQLADENNIDEIFLPYNYAQDEFGNCVTTHKRERLLRRSVGFEWRGWVHETCITDKKHISHVLDSPTVVHNTSPEHAKESGERNHAILAKAYAETEDPRYLMYLGSSLFSLKQYEKSIALLLDFLKVSGSKEDVHRSLCFISEAAYHLDNFELAVEYATKAAVLMPETPMAYWLLAQYEADSKNWHEALEWVKVSMSKPDPQTLSVWDPTARERAVLIAAQAEFMLQNYNKALAWLKKIPKNKSAQDLFEGFIEEADAETFVNLLPRIRKYFKNDELLWKSLATDLQYDTRLLSLRQAVNKPKKWGDKSIVIFCGEGYEEWGPHTLDKGMGGSEEAVVYLSYELAKLGYDVTVFAEYDSANTAVVDWRPWKEIDVRDEFNIFVAWRAPQFLERINAKVKLADIHDIVPVEAISDDPDVTHLVKSEYHKNLYTDKKPNADFRVIGNGIKKDQF